MIRIRRALVSGSDKRGVEEPARGLSRHDIGGLSMIRSASKNHERVTVVVDPDDYAALIEELDAHAGQTSAELRFRFARKAFAYTAAYDGAIANWLTALDEKSESVALKPF